MPDPTDALICEHVPLARRIAGSYSRRLPAHVDRDNLTGAAMLALVLAARAFDPERGVPFAAFATTRIRCALADELRAADWATRGVRHRARAAEQARDGLTGRLGRAPTAVEVAAELGIATSDLAAVDADTQRATVLSIDGLTAAHVPDPPADHGEGPEDAVLDAEEQQLLHDAIEHLPDRLRLVVEESYLLEHRYAAIADQLGVTESRVSQLRSEAVARLRRQLADSRP